MVFFFGIVSLEFTCAVTSGELAKQLDSVLGEDKAQSKETYEEGVKLRIRSGLDVSRRDPPVTCSLTPPPVLERRKDNRRRLSIE